MPYLKEPEAVVTVPLVLEPDLKCLQTAWPEILGMLMVRQELKSDEMLCSVVTDMFRGRHESSNEGTQDS